MAASLSLRVIYAAAFALPRFELDQAFSPVD